MRAKPSITVLALFLAACESNPGSVGETDGGSESSTSEDADTEDVGSESSGSDETGGTTDEPSECEGLNVSDEGAVTLDLRAVPLGLTVTLDGQAMPDAAVSRGTIVLRPQGTQHDDLRIELGATGSTDRVFVVAPGTYDVIYEANPEFCAQPEHALPCIGNIVRAGLSVNAEALLDVDIATARLSGQVTLSNAPLPAGPRGGLRLISESGQGSTLPPLAEQYTVRVTRGSYDIAYVSDGGCNGQEQRDYPCFDGVVTTDILVDADGLLPVDIPAVTVSGSVTVDGSPMAQEDGERGALAFRPSDSPDASHPGFEVRTFGARGDATFITTVVAGRYDLEFRSNPALCDGNTIPSVPCSGGELVRNLDLQRNGAVDLDLSTLQLTGQVKQSGQSLPEGTPRGELYFAPAERGSPAVVSLGTQGDEPYRLRLLAGTYDVNYAPAATPCEPSQGPSMPCNAGTVIPDMAFEQSGSLDIDIPRVRLRGEVTLTGLPQLPEGPRGALGFADDTGTWWFQSLPDTAAATYDVALLPGRYDIAYTPDPQSCHDNPDQPLPCAVHPFARGFEVASDGVFDVDLSPVRLAIELLVNGEPVDDADAQGYLLVTPVPGGFGHQRALEATGAGNYLLRTEPGAYLFEHHADAQVCTQNITLGNVPGQMPCTSQVVLGCDD